MDLVILFDWFTNESMDAALQATEWQQREMFLRLALMWGDSSATVPQRSTDDTIIGLIDAAKEDGAGYYDVALPHLPFRPLLGELMPSGRFQKVVSNSVPLHAAASGPCRWTSIPRRGCTGEQVLRERCGSDVSSATIDALVAAVIDILAKSCGRRQIERRAGCFPTSTRCTLLYS